MNSFINFVELENRVISATYRNLMLQAKVVLVDQASGEQLARACDHDHVAGPDRMVEDQVAGRRQAGRLLLQALNGHGRPAAQSGEFYVG